MNPAEVSAILWEVWDPLGLRAWANVPNEYDDYVPEILTLLNRGASEAEVASELNKIFVAAIGGGVLSVPFQNSSRTAKALVKSRDLSSRRHGKVE
jgi:hypothetical protein